MRLSSAGMALTIAALAFIPAGAAQAQDDVCQPGDPRVDFEATGEIASYNIDRDVQALRILAAGAQGGGALTGGLPGGPAAVLIGAVSAADLDGETLQFLVGTGGGPSGPSGPFGGGGSYSGGGGSFGAGGGGSSFFTATVSNTSSEPTNQGDGRVIICEIRPLAFLDVEEPLAFGDVFVNSTSEKTVTLQNTGVADVTGLTFTTSNSQFGVIFTTKHHDGFVMWPSHLVHWDCCRLPAWSCWRRLGIGCVPRLCRLMTRSSTAH